MSDDLPQFDRPPVVEVALGVEFLTLPALSVVPLVELRPLWQDRYPLVQEQPALPSASVGGAPFGFQIASGVPPVRLWFLSDDQTELLQVQSDRMVLNWRRMSEGDEYPRFRTLAPRFDQNWQAFEGAIKEKSLGELRPIVAEVSYVNRFVLGDGESIFDALSVFGGGPFPKGAQPEIQYVVPLTTEHRGQVVQFGQQNVTAGRVSNDGPNEVHLTVTTRVEVAGDGLSAIQSALMEGHILGVNGFADATTRLMHERWGRNR